MEVEAEGGGEGRGAEDESTGDGVDGEGVRAGEEASRTDAAASLGSGAATDGVTSGTVREKGAEELIGEEKEEDGDVFAAAVANEHATGSTAAGWDGPTVKDGVEVDVVRGLGCVSPPATAAAAAAATAATGVAPPRSWASTSWAAAASTALAAASYSACETDMRARAAAGGGAAASEPPLACTLRREGEGAGEEEVEEVEVEEVVVVPIVQARGVVLEVFVVVTAASDDDVVVVAVVVDVVGVAADDGEEDDDGITPLFLPLVLVGAEAGAGIAVDDSLPSSDDIDVIGALVVAVMGVGVTALSAETAELAVTPGEGEQGV